MLHAYPFLLQLDELAHEVAQELRAASVTGFSGHREFGFQGFVDPKSEGGFAHFCRSHVLQTKCIVTRPKGIKLFLTP